MFLHVHRNVNWTNHFEAGAEAFPATVHFKAVIVGFVQTTGCPLGLSIQTHRLFPCSLGLLIRVHGSQHVSCF